MAIQLSDDGTMDTVLVCSECGEEFRYNFDGSGLDDDTTEESAYDDFVAWAIADATDDHECAPRPRCSDCGGSGTAGHYPGFRCTTT